MQHVFRGVTVVVSRTLYPVSHFVTLRKPNLAVLSGYKAIRFSCSRWINTGSKILNQLGQATLPFPTSLHPDLAESLRTNNFIAPTEIQSRSYEFIRSGRHTMITAETGSGKTLAYLIPILDRLLSTPEQKTTNIYNRSPRCVLLAPTQHLQLQLIHVLEKLLKSENGARLPLSCSIHPPPPGIPYSRLSNPDIAVTSAAAILSHYKKEKDLRAFLEQTQIIVLDEADWVIDEGPGVKLMEYARRILSGRADSHPLQMIFAAATMAPIKTKNSRVARSSIVRAFGDVEVASSSSLHTTADNIKERFISMPESAEVDSDTEFNAKSQELLKLVLDASHLADGSAKPEKWLVFCGAGSRSEKVHNTLAVELEAHCAQTRRKVLLSVMHGDLQREERSRYIMTFSEMPAEPNLVLDDKSSSNPINILISTDIVSRGVDFKDVSKVIHFDFPKNATEYLHRVGRAGRNRRGHGESIGFVMDRNADLAGCIREASCGAEEVFGTRLLNHNRYAVHLDNDADKEELLSSVKFPLTGILSRKRSFAK
ncbi:hypothetical protein BASA50_005404 [Batrachochytrium salamandrivorans]|uniref:RNA helicase n=1 Tax=Batrachochytrium salamandrivorans TaxID=1357716 RepID=A0ABQ8FCW9_9FUNG|nr:hypothetical protein BASA50_005404 [Batrachochytrium salamandrivorans]